MNTISFMSPIELTLSAWLEHIPFAFWLINAHKPRVLVELGTHYGSSYFAFCQAINQLNLSTKTYAVDMWKGDEHAGFYGENVYNSVLSHNNHLYSRFSTLMRTSFDEASEHFTDGEIDLLHIDGYHTYEAVKNDFNVWLPKLSNRGVVIIHD
ncbi:class I SAM-dependent methyltransferase, partial [Pantoea deleyi]